MIWGHRHGLPLTCPAILLGEGRPDTRERRKSRLTLSSRYLFFPCALCLSIYLLRRLVFQVSTNFNILICHETRRGVLLWKSLMECQKWEFLWRLQTLGLFFRQLLSATIGPVNLLPIVVVVSNSNQTENAFPPKAIVTIVSEVIPSSLFGCPR